MYSVILYMYIFFVIQNNYRYILSLCIYNLNLKKEDCIMKLKRSMKVSQAFLHKLTDATYFRGVGQKDLINQMIDMFYAEIMIDSYGNPTWLPVWKFEITRLGDGSRIEEFLIKSQYRNNSGVQVVLYLKMKREWYGGRTILESIFTDSLSSVYGVLRKRFK